jgi:hypothetical protein
MDVNSAQVGCGCPQASAYTQAGALDYAGGVRNCPDARGRTGGHARRLGAGAAEI